MRGLGVGQCPGDISQSRALAGLLDDFNLHMASLISQFREAPGSVTSSSRSVRQKDPNRRTGNSGMHPSSTSTTPFSVKDILKLGHHHDFENEFLMTNQVVPMHYQHAHDASRGMAHVHDCQPEPCVSGMQEKLDAHSSAAEEEINEQGEMLHDN